MARVAITELQKRGAINSGWGLYDTKGGWRGSVRYGLPAAKAGVPYFHPDWAPGQPAPWSRGMAALGASCPEGSRLVNGECVCHEGRVWMPDGSRCVSPQAPAYTGAVSIQDQQASSPVPISQQPLTDAARRYLQSKGYTVSCTISTNWDAGPQGGVPPMLCSINGGPYEHAAYAINANPYNVVAVMDRERAVQQVSQATGIPGGALYSSPETTAAVDRAMSTGTVDQGAVTAAVEATQAREQLRASLVPGVDYDVATGMPISWRAEVAGSNRVELPLVYEAINLPPGATLANPAGPSAWSNANSTGGPTDPGIGFDASGIPWYVWAAGAAGAYFMLKDK